MARALDRDKLLTAFDDIGRAAATAGTTLQIVVYGGSALMLASNFRFATEDADVAPLERPWPDWLQRAVERITAENGWP
jgi:predicted proteasome-type protease